MIYMYIVRDSPCSKPLNLSKTQAPRNMYSHVQNLYKGFFVCLQFQIMLSDPSFTRLMPGMRSYSCTVTQSMTEL